jgi:uncharacterized protein (DUF342 family)
MINVILGFIVCLTFIFAWIAGKEFGRDFGAQKAVKNVILSLEEKIENIKWARIEEKAQFEMELENLKIFMRNIVEEFLKQRNF